MEKEDFEKLLDEYTSDLDIESTLKEKDDGTFSDKMSAGEKIKDYPGVQKVLDLHMKTSNEAKMSIELFIQDCVHFNLKTIEIITGKGLHSKNQQAVLPDLTKNILIKMRQNRTILTFKKDKTGGSFVVYLR